MKKIFGILWVSLIGLLFLNPVQLLAQRIQMIDIIGDVDSVTAEFKQKLALTKTKETGKSYVLSGKLGGESSTLELVVRYTVPSYFIDAQGKKVIVTPEICSHISGNKPVMNFPNGVKSVHWENMVYFSNLLLDTRLTGNQIATDYRVINNLTKLDAERALVPAAPKLDF